MSPIILDTSVVVSGFLSPHGAAGSLVVAAFHDRLRLAYSPSMLAEYAEALARPELAPAITSQDRIAFLMKLRSSGMAIMPVPVPDDDWPDPDDLPFVAAALATDHEIIVTLNPRDFAPAKRHGIDVLSPSVAKRRLL
jgi:putative PIN family toxin of toxin-antitoxin system